MQFPKSAAREPIRTPRATCNPWRNYGPLGPTQVGVFAVTSNHQRFAIHDGNQASLLQLSQVLFHNVHQSLDFGRSQSTAHGGLRRQFLPWPQVLGPIFGATRPGRRPFMHHSPEVNHYDLEVKDSCRVSNVPNDQTPYRFGTMSTRVRVPCLISLKKGSNKISMYANSPIFPAFPTPMLADE